MSTTIAAALGAAQQLAAVSDSGRLDAELLLADCLGKGREYLVSHAEQQLDQATLYRFHQAMERRRKGEPVAYILGRKGFWDFELTVTPAVLIPRPETELIVEASLELATALPQSAVRAADLGTGSGALAIAIGRENPDWQVTAVDSSAEALAVAAANARRLGTDNIDFRQGSWCAPLAADAYSLIVVNPPYVAADDDHLQQDGLPFEPRQALVAGDDGFADLETIIAQSPRCLKRDSWLLLEHGFQQAAAVREHLVRQGFVDIHSRRDYAGHERMTQARWPGTTETDQ